ncbi:phage tail tape measure protein [Salinicoccus halitifaciens]|uniref:lysostaphin n=1 Tax=Salinicoccus halitifaciens TaxID=1073415 RepID=A0ABV2E5T4_9STAP|nr:phage tail tape measure protein [Salinicoccus halitifaciens]
MVVDLDLNTTKLNSSVTGLQRQMRMVNSALKANLSGLKDSGSESDRLATKIDGLNKKQKIQEAIVEETEKNYQELVKTKGAASKEAEAYANNLNKEQAKLRDVTAELEEMERQHKVMTSPWTKLSQGLDDYGNRLKSIGDHTMQIGKTGMKWITAPAVALGTVGVKSAMDYEYAMSKVQGLLNATDEDMSKLDASAKEWGGSTSYSATEVANAFEFMSLAGWDVEQQTQSIGGALKFTEATGLELAHGVDLITDSMGALGIETADLDGYLDSLVATQSNSNTTAEEMMQAYIRAGSTMNAMNFSVDETNAMLGVLADNGIKGAEAGTKLNSIFAKLVNPTGQTAQAFEDLGISMANADGTMKSSDEILQEIKTKTEGLTDAERNRYISMIAGTENLSSMNTLLDASGGKLEEYTKLNEESNGALDELHTIMKDNLKGDFEEFVSSLEATALSIGEMLLPAVRNIIQWMTDMINKFNDLSDGTKGAIVAFGGVAAAIPPVLVGVGGFIKIVGSAMTSLAPLASSIAKNGGLLKTLGLAFRGLTGPIGLGITIIGVLVTAFMTAYTNSETFRNGIQAVGDKAKEVWDYIKEFGSGVKNLFTGSEENGKKILSAIGVTDDNISRITGLRDNILEVKDRVLELGNSIADRVRPALQGVMDFIDEVGTSLTSMWEDNSANIIPIVTNIGNGISNVFKGILATIEFIMPAVEFIIKMVWENIQGVIRGGLKVIDGLVKLFSGIFTGDFSKMWEGVKSIFTGAIQAVWNGFQLLFYGRIIKGVGSLVKLFTGSIRGLWTSVTGFFRNLFDDGVIIIGQLNTRINNIVSRLVSSVINFFRRMFNNTIDTVRRLGSRAYELFRNMGTRVSNTVGNLFRSVRNFFTNMRSNVTSITTRLRDTAVNLFNALRTRVTNTVRNLYNSVRNLFSNLLSNVRSTVTNLRNRVVNLFTNMRTRVVSGVQNLRDKVSNLFGRIRDRATDIFDKMVDGAKKLPRRLGNAIKNGASKAVDGVKSLGNSIINQLEKVINRVIGGLNNITGKLGITSTISEVSINRFSKGTGAPSSATKNGAIAHDMLATVGDRGIGNGKGTRELVQYPDGTAGLYDNDATIFAPKGTIIYNNRQTEEILDSLPRFSKGTTNAGSGTKNGNNKKDKKGLFGTIGDVLSNTWDYIKNPGKALDAVIDSIAPDFSGFSGFAGALLRGGFNFFKDKALDWITGIFKDNEGGEVSGGSILNRAITARFGRYPAHIARQLGVTRHYGLDTAHRYERLTSPVTGKVTRVWHDKYGGNSIQIKSGELNWWFMHMQSIARQVGDMVKAGKTNLGVTGNTGLRTTGYHLHTQAMRGGIGNAFAIDPLPLLKKAGYATGGFVTDGLYRLGEEGYGEWIIPTDPKRRTDAMKLLAYAGKSLQKNNGNLRPNNLPNINTSNEVSELKQLINKQQEQLDQNNQMIELLAKIAEKEYVALYDKRKLAKELEPEITKRAEYENGRRARFS